MPLSRNTSASQGRDTNRPASRPPHDLRTGRQAGNRAVPARTRHDDVGRTWAPFLGNESEVPPRDSESLCRLRSMRALTQAITPPIA